jgi:hypothetical protein
VVTTRTHTVKQTNIDPAFESAKAENCTLSILREQDGLSFLVKNSTTTQLYMIGYIPSSELSVDPFHEVQSFFPQIPNKVIMASDYSKIYFTPEGLNAGNFGLDKPSSWVTRQIKFSLLSNWNIRPRHV